jgi:hypothetical protein
VAFLGKNADRIDGYIKEIDNLGTAPMDGGDEVTAMLKTMLVGLRDAFTQAKNNISTAKSQGQNRYAAAVQSAGTDLQAAAEKAAQIGKEFDAKAKSIKAVDVAFNLADDCKKLRSTS